MMNKLTPQVRVMMEDARKAATITVQFEDGTQLDTCAAVPPSLLPQFLEVAPSNTNVNAENTRGSDDSEIATPAPAAPDRVTVVGERSTTPSALTNNDILQLLKSGFSSKIIVAKINVSVCQFDTSPQALQALQQAGVPEDVMLAMVQAPVGSLAAPK